MGTVSLAGMITPHPCNQAQEDRNWAALNNLLQILDQIIVINIDEITNVVTYNIQNITNLSVTNIDVTNIDVTNIDVTNIYVTNIAEFVTIDVTTINVTTINVVNIFATYITSYSLTYNILISVYGNGDPVYICPEVCAEGDTGSGGGGGEVFNACNGDIGVPETLTATYSNKTGDCSCLPSTDTIAWDGISMMWEGLYEECNGCGIELRCVDGVWTLGKASCVGVATLVSFTAYPFEVVFDVDNSVGGLTNCTETYRVTITA